MDAGGLAQGREDRGAGFLPKLRDAIDVALRNEALAEKEFFEATTHLQLREADGPDPFPIRRHEHLAISHFGVREQMMLSNKFDKCEFSSRLEARNGHAVH
ncbi:protein of unknown function [Hyphomicrobium sp. MC1]|nr:protein of unknown function [Hyphomicrobium sp. MC1]